jgi:hypothetical protein
MEERMAEVRLNVRDRHSVIHGEVHGSIADAVIASLSAEPETITELEAALERFMKPKGDVKPLGLFRQGLSQEPCAAGIIIVDMAARIVAGNSSYSPPLAQGQIQYQDGSQSSETWILYRAPDDWLFLDSIGEYEAHHEARKALYTLKPLDSRAVFYGPPMIEFLVNGCLDALESKTEDAIAGIHANWLMTPRADLRGQTPREVILEKKNFIDVDLQFRAMQWSELGEGPSPLGRETFAYMFGGFGTHEWVTYYDLLRHLLNSCWERMQAEETVDAAAEKIRLEAVMQAWLDEPCDDLGHRIPSAIIECERRRIPMTLTAKQTIIDENCDVCRLMADESAGFGPAFWHLDGSHMDDGFEFSHFRTRAEYDEEERRRREFDQEFNRKWAAGELD